MTAQNPDRASYAEYERLRRENWDRIAHDRPRTWGDYYHAYIEQIYRKLIPAGAAVLEIGCGKGDLLAGLKPSSGIGVDLSPNMISAARSRHPNLEFLVGDVHDVDLGKRKFDFIVMSDVINDLWDVQTVLQGLRCHCTPSTRIIFNFFSQLWKPPLNLAQKLNLAIPMMLQNWFTSHDLQNMLELTGYESLRAWSEIACPLKIPFVSHVTNRILAKLAPLRFLAITNFLIARPSPAISGCSSSSQDPSVSVVVPARNEAGHIEQLLTRIPELGSGTEIVFVEGNSTDNTYETIKRCVAQHASRRCLVMKQSGKGKGDAVRTGFEAASGDILMILDADITVAPEDLPRFYDALVSGRGELINGVRLVYPMDEEAMRLANLIGNKLFSWAFSWLLGQKIRDTLCGTKAIWAKDYSRIAKNRAYFGEFDPFGDFDLLFGAAKLNLKIMEVPIRYHARQYGTTNIQRWRHGLILLRMVLFAARRIKFS
jgi:ubiquinone/menaquinone biosynthesis C-methylase UbiE